MPPQVYTVQPGDTLLEIALEHDMTVEELMAYNSLESDIIVEGQALLLPPPTPTPGPTPTLKPGEPTATPAPFILYTVKPGDTLSTIAEEFGVSLKDLRIANDIPPDSETIRDGQVLQIPRYTPTPTPEASQWLIASGTPTPRSAYSAPMPIYPPDNATFTGPDALVILQWTSSGILEDNAYYRVELSVPTVDGPTKTYFYQQSTALRLPTELFPTADVEERVCVWHVDVVQTQSETDTLTDQPAEAYKAMSPKSESRTFFWEVPSS
jgi:LysM repeat protein